DVIAAQQKIKVHANKKYYAISAISENYVNSWIQREARGRVFLDYACGNGSRAIFAASRGAHLAIGLDISDVSVRNARGSAEQAGVGEACIFVQGDCEATELPDESVDCILCCGMLHHLDLSRAYPELYRILKPGGRILGVEAFGHNPIIQLYRNLTPHLRTDWEKQHILKQRDIDAALTHGFVHGELRYWHLFALGAVPFRGTFLFKPCLTVLNTLDRGVLAVPGIRLMAWQVTFELIKPPAKQT
ncbi:MAG: methyltransferase domain-containing protein, partial [Rickettsiales bacterium]